jgi:hypothetical protein
MKTEHLINAIAADGAAGPASVRTRLAVALAIGGFCAGALFAGSLGVRYDIGVALQSWRWLAKIAIVLAAFAAALWATAQLARPEADQRKLLAALLVPVVMLVLAVGGELAATDPESWSVRAIGTNSRLCLAAITLLSIAPLASLLVALRAGAPRSPAIAGAAAGLLAGSLAAVLYALHCFDDSPLFVALWYTPAIALVTLAGAAAGSRALRW